MPVMWSHYAHLRDGIIKSFIYSEQPQEILSTCSSETNLKIKLAQSKKYTSQLQYA